MKENGNISIHAENILPIIKRWLYSEKEIFLRELVSNSIDALTKLNKIALTEDVGELPESQVSISIDKSAKTLTITDTGIGMTADEIKKYINQVAFSGVQDFVEKYQGKDESQQIIGHFGLGFYSSFMVAEKVEIDTLSYRPDAQAVRWSCDGGVEFNLSPSERNEVGTSIILHIDDDSKEMLEAGTIREILSKYCSFMPFLVLLEGDVVNETRPIWTRNANELKDEDYIEFYRKNFPLSGDPLFWIHLNVDFPFQLSGILYFPKLRNELDASQGEVKLFCNQVYVADNCKELMPEFLTLLKGALDCSDLPLNVSRSNLQKDPKAQKISQHVLKKVADKLTGLAKTEPEQFRKYWKDIGPLIKFGMLKEHKLYERMIDHIIFETQFDKAVTLGAYLDENGKKTSDKIIYSYNFDQQHAYVDLYKQQETAVILADTLIDKHFLPYVEMRSSGKFKFQRVDAAVSENLIDKDAEKSRIVDPKDNKTSDQKVEEIFGKYLKNDKVKVKAEGLKSSHLPGVLVMDENVRRMQEMSAMTMPGSPMLETKDLEHTLVVNINNPVVKKLVKLDGTFNKDEEVKTIVHHIYDLAFLQHGNMTAEMMQSFIQRSAGLLEKISGMADPVAQ